MATIDSVNQIIICILCILAFSRFVRLTPEPRIIGGTKVTERSEFAYQALLLYAKSVFCGGTIIDDKHILTAAHCSVEDDGSLIRTSRVSVAVGNLNSSDRRIIKSVKNIFVHQYFDATRLINDIAVWRISGTFENTTSVQPIVLQTNQVTSGQCNVSGWGTTKSGSQTPSPYLLYVEVPLVNRQECNFAYMGVITKNQICAGSRGKDSCQGDSGGPLVCSGKLTGVVSYGNDCGLAYFPGVYTNVANYRNWIEQQKLRSKAETSAISILSVIISLALINYFH